MDTLVALEAAGAVLPKARGSFELLPRMYYGQSRGGMPLYPKATG